MHIVFFADQHLDSLGGAQVSMRLQKRFLETAGHTVTVVAPRMHAARVAGFAPGLVDTPSWPITPDREYSVTWPGRRADRFVDEALAIRPPVDLVHVQADFWGAMTGHRFAARHALPLVHTMHNRIGVGIAATMPFPALAVRVLCAVQRRMLALPAPERDTWAYQRGFAERSDAVTVPSSHFADRLAAHAVAPRSGGAVDVIWNGIDDDMLRDALPARASRPPGPPRLVWIGRMSPEKRLLPFLDALCDSGVHADVQVLGGGGQLQAAQRLVARRRPAASVLFGGRMGHSDVLRHIAQADAVVQTSIGFETQGMTVFEASALGTPSIVSDPDIAAELGSGYWQVPDASTTALAAVIARAAADIEAGKAPVPDPAIGEHFRQSSRTAAMIRVYERVLAGRTVGGTAR